ncbi:MAG: phosphate regulon sensor histidine kinase PhoR [Rhodocyclaceae bacterium]|nr:MAG: phosphate regulon sensor histidine kinase PhoR [Rhodocyclaceae bacterium]
MFFWVGPLLRLTTLVLTALAVGLFVSATAGWVLLVIGLASAYGYHLIRLARLTRWLNQTHQGKVSDVPESLGEWGDAFAALYRLRRDEQAGRARLSDSLERLSQAAEALPDGIVLLDSMLRIEWCNSAATLYLGTDAVRDRGVPITHLMREPVFAAYLQGESRGEPVIIRSASPPERTLSLSLIPFAESGRLLISRDITALERADTVRRDFVANVSHELRTPLTVIVGFLEGLAAGDVFEAQDLVRQYALMYDQALRMERLVKDLLTLSALDDTQSPANEELIDVPLLLSTLVEEGRALSGGKHDIRLEISARNLYGSREELRSAFSNLITNALRYTQTDGSVAVRWILRDGMPVFEVTDDGIGIAPEHIQRLTERFYRVDKGRSSATGGTGLGLAIVKHIMIRHQAKLEIESTPGKGSTFRAVFPKTRLP